MKDCCIIIPIYNVKPTKNEILSITRNCMVLDKYDIFFVHPFMMDISEYESLVVDLYKCERTSIEDSAKKTTSNVLDRIKFIPFKRKYFKSNKSYSRLILSERFYFPFYDYEYMLIAQTDTYILNNRDYCLEDFISQSRSQNIDYWGAPWCRGPFYKPYSFKDRIKLIIVKHPEKIFVGNGGFSLRHIQNSLKLIQSKRNLIDFFWRFNEDMFFSYFASINFNGYSSATKEDAAKFALEENMNEEISKGNVPYALHAFEKHMKKADFHQICEKYALPSENILF